MVFCKLKKGQWKKSCISLICEESDSLASVKSMTKAEKEKETLLSGQFHRQAFHERKGSLYTHHPDFQSSIVGHAPPLPPSPVRRLPYAWKHCGTALLPCAHAVIQWISLTLIIMLKYLQSMNF